MMSSMIREPISRRQFMACALGGASAGLASMCGALGLGGIALWLTRQQDEDDTPLVIVPNDTPTPENPPPAIVRRAAWGALPPNLNARHEYGFFDPDNNPEGWRVYDQPLPEVYQTVVIHHSVEWEDDDLSTLAFIQDLHRDDRGWADVAYHYFVGRNGTLYEGRALNVRGVHVGGYNTGSVGVCLLGNFMTVQPNQAQLDAAQALVNWLAAELALTHLAGHRAFNDGTLCPGDNLVPHLPNLARVSGLTLGTDGYQGPTPAPEAHTPGCGCHA